MADRSRSSDDDEGELENLESDVNQMAAKIAEYRKSLPDQLTTTLASILTAQRPVVLPRFDAGSEPGPSANSSSDARRPVESGTTTLQAGEYKEYAEKIESLKQKLSSNASAMPNALKRMNECISRIDKLDSCNGIIHPAFKRKRTS